METYSHQTELNCQTQFLLKLKPHLFNSAFCDYNNAILLNVARSKSQMI